MKEARTFPCNSGNQQASMHVLLADAQLHQSICAAICMPAWAQLSACLGLLHSTSPTTETMPCDNAIPAHAVHDFMSCNAMSMPCHHGYMQAHACRIIDMPCSCITTSRAAKHHCRARHLVPRSHGCQEQYCIIMYEWPITNGQETNGQSPIMANQR